MISRSSRSAILKIIFKIGNAFEFANNREEGIIPFLNEIWDLKSMPSEDNRFPDAERDIIQHTINNDDWDWQELFEKRLRVVDDEDKFYNFLNVFLLPKYQNNNEDIFSLIESINEVLKNDDLVLAVISYEESFPVFEITDIIDIDRPVNVPINKIPFFILPYPSMRVSKFADVLQVDHDKPSQYFILIEDNWDDFSHVTTFFLVYFNNGQKTSVGEVKIGSEKDFVSVNVLSSEFFNLEDGFFSLGQSFRFYETLNKLFGKNALSILYSLKDVAFFVELAEEYEMLDVFRKSLIRDDEAERVLRTVKPVMSGRDLENLYSFEYKFMPKYANASVLVPFHFSSDTYLPKRIVALIGKNGAGKTQLLTKLPQDISKGGSDLLIPNRPIFSKVIAVSYSTFDNFDIPKKTTDFNYVYCGLRDESGNLRGSDGQLKKFHNTWKKIAHLGRLEKWKKIISNFLDANLIDLFIKIKPDDESALYFDKLGFKKARESLSSGQSIILFVVSEIVANIRFDSLLLFDEPETHLHPNAISQLMNGIVELVGEFESYCIIATHSPIIIQEMFSRDVLVISREEDIPSVKKIGIESFGENLSIITEEIFGSREIPKFYEATIKRLFKIYGNYDDVLDVMKRGNLPLSLNVRLYLQSLVEKDA